MQQNKVATIFSTVILALLLLAPILTRTASTLNDTANNLEVSVSRSPTRIHEGDNTTITIEISSATPLKTYTFGINVSNPAGTSSAINITIPTDAIGSGNSSTQYWGAFTEANTDYVGTYLVAAKNVTTDEILATTSFMVGLTDKVKYARNETVNIRGTGYGANKSVTIDVKLNEKQIVKQNITVSTLGIVNYTWQIPGNATPGVYTVSIINATSPSTVKSPSDVQDFYVEVWQVQIWARNLANEPIVDLTIKVYNETIVPAQFLSVPPQETNETGWSSFMLAIGNYTFKGFWKQVEVGSLLSKPIKSDTVLEKERWVQLSNLKMTVIDEATDEPLPFIQLRLEYNYTTEAYENLTETSYSDTNFTGTVYTRNLFVNNSYVVEATRYGERGLSLPPIQNTTLPLPWNNITIKFPVHTLFVRVVDSKNNAIEGVRVEAHEWSSGLTQNETTGSNGNVTFSLTFGRYRVRVYNGTILLNETLVDLTQDQSSFLIYLSNYNIDFTVEVVDYFRQPIPNAMVEIERKIDGRYELTAPSGFTGTDGRVTFSGILGGDSRISIYIGERLSGTRDLYLMDSEEVTFNLNGYVVIVSYAMETSQFVTAIALAVLSVTFIVALTYKRLLKIFVKSK